MTDESPSSNSQAPTLPSPLRCLGGAVVAGAIAFLLYGLTQSIALTFATKGVTSDNLTAQRIATAVRTLVLGLSALGTGIFGFSALGLTGLAIQTALKSEKSPS